MDIYIIYECICRNIAKGYSRGRDKKGFFLIRITAKLLSKCYKIWFDIIYKNEQKEMENERNR